MFVRVFGIEIWFQNWIKKPTEAHVPAVNRPKIFVSKHLIFKQNAQIHTNFIKFNKKFISYLSVRFNRTVTVHWHNQFAVFHPSDTRVYRYRYL